ncbi:hypothetical protein BT96DRAFT_309892 [Gymnopus androsaceus JB14]|uniref:Uncharacterized protein n=1 Tax=Gymnopus androsaceus JB14 TaxID=1447944 RepID=A0A6A4GZN7_9AGAR|nr:hypothetical protein BT96DRAFT_309892 [Gymnopus androsaceus JB14]
MNATVRLRPKSGLGFALVLLLHVGTACNMLSYVYDSIMYMTSLLIPKRSQDRVSIHMSTIYSHTHTRTHSYTDPHWPHTYHIPLQTGA